MKYISVGEAAEKWGITKRRVQEYCYSGRINGAIKIGSVWTVPKQAEKPTDPRRGSAENIKNEDVYYNNTTGLFPGVYILDTVCLDGRPLEQIADDFKYNTYKLAFWAEVETSKGNFTKALELLKKLPKNGEFALVAIHLRWICGHALDNAKERERCVADLDLLKRQYFEDQKELLLIEIVEAIWTTCTYKNEGCPEWMKNGDVSKVPREFSKIAAYTYVRYLHNEGKFAQMIGVCEGASRFMSEGNFFALDIYFEAFRAIGYISLGDIQKSREILYNIFTATLKYEFYPIFIEFLVFLGGQMEIILKQHNPKLRRVFSDSWKQLFKATEKNWENQDVEQSSIEEDLSPNLRELEVLHLIRLGFRHKEIAKIMELNVNTVSSLAQKVKLKRKALSFEKSVFFTYWFKQN